MKKTASLVPTAVLAGAILMSAPAAEAHHAEFMSNAPFLQGISMPVHGLDHLLSALAVGLLAARMRTLRGTILLTTVYALVALAGGLLNVSGIALPDFAVPLTVATTGLLLWRGTPGGWVPACAAIAAAGFCHGDALLNVPAGGDHWTLFAAGCLGATLAVCGAALFAARYVAEARLRIAGIGLLVATGLLAIFPEANGILVRLLEGPL
jgi:urease accessory protein